MYKITVDGEPVGKARPRVTARGTYTPKKTKDYEKLVKYTYISKYNKTLLENAIEINIKAYFKIPKSTSNKKRTLMISDKIRPTKKPDLDNVLKCITDALNDVAYIDDKQIVKASIEKYYSENPRVIIEIKEIN